MTKAERRDAFYLLAVFKAAVAGMALDEDAENDRKALSDAAQAVMNRLAAVMDDKEKRAAKNQVSYKTVTVVTKAAHPYPIGDEVVVSVDDLNELFYHGREECVLCEKTHAQAVRCPVYKIFRKYNMLGVCDK